MGSPLSRRQTLGLTATAIAGGTAGCLGGDPPEGTVDYSVLDAIDWASAPPLDRLAVRTP